MSSSLSQAAHRANMRGGIIYYLLLLLLLDEFNNVRFANRGHIRAKRAHSISAPRADEMCCCAAAAGTLLWQAAGRERGKERDLLCSATE
jgi:hypothetical protein